MQLHMQLAVTECTGVNFSFYDKILLSAENMFDKAFSLVNKHELKIFYSKVVLKVILSGHFHTINSYKIICFLIFPLKCFSDT